MQKWAHACQGAGKIKKKLTNSVGQLDFHQVPLNVKLRVKRGEHALKRLVGEGKKKGKHKANGQEMPGGGRNGRSTATKTVETNHRRLFQQAESSSFLWLHTLCLSISFPYCFSHNVPWYCSNMVRAAFHNAWAPVADWSSETWHVSRNLIWPLNDLWACSAGEGPHDTPTPPPPPHFSQTQAGCSKKWWFTLVSYITCNQWKTHNPPFLLF